MSQKMQGSCACGLCGLSIDKGTRVFAVIEMFLVLMHIKHIYDAGSDVIIATELGLSENFYIHHLFKATLCVCLILLSVFAFLLYFVGYNAKNVTVCWIWIGIAITTWLNCAVLIVILLLRVAPPIPRSTGHRTLAQLEEFTCGGRSHLFVAVYETYLLYGVWIVFRYIKWIQKGGTIGELIEIIVDPIMPSEGEQSFSLPVQSVDSEIQDLQVTQSKQEPVKQVP